MNTPVFAAIPHVLTLWPQWVLWVGTPKNTHPDALDKQPYAPHASSYPASTTDPKTWGTFGEAQRTLPGFLVAMSKKLGSTYRGGGLGFVFSSEDPYCGVDLDHCRDPQTGDITPWAQVIIAQLNSYSEVTPSEAGLHVLVEGGLPPAGRKKGALEMYDTGRFFTMTGAHLAGTPTDICARHEALTSLHQATFGVARTPTSRPAAPSPTADDTALLSHMRAAKNGDKFARLWAGDTTEYSSPSSADFALIGILAFWTQDISQVDRLFRQSGLMREKWDMQRGGQTYGMRTIDKVLSCLSAHYQRRYTPTMLTTRVTLSCEREVSL
jgi:putative DNA primase/helicase